jgi:hypothetical protein
MNERNDWMVVFKDNENPSRCYIADIRSNDKTGTIGDLSKCLAYRTQHWNQIREHE